MQISRDATKSRAVKRFDFFPVASLLLLAIAFAAGSYAALILVGPAAPKGLPMRRAMA